MTPVREWSLGLAFLAQQLGRDLQRAARAAGGPEALWRMPSERLGALLRIEGDELAHAVRVRRGFDAVVEGARLERAGIAHVPLRSARYPERLAEIHDPPFGLFVRAPAGALDRLDERPVVAVVGSRRATAPGRRLAHDLAAELTRRGAVIVSGLAHGIDTAAHEGALSAGGTTVAVLGCGVDVRYPRRNAGLAERIAASGAIASEYWPGTPPAPWRFPARNRIVAGLAHATCVVEAGRRSGALITADFGLEAGRPVLAVPGWPGSVASEGTNALIRAGAAVLEEAADVVAELPDAAWRPVAASPPARPDGLAARVYEQLRCEPLRADQLSDRIDADAAGVAGALALLEVEGLVIRGDGRRYWAASRPGGAGC